MRAYYSGEDVAIMLKTARALTIMTDRAGSDSPAGGFTYATEGD